MFFSCDCNVSLRQKKHSQASKSYEKHNDILEDFQIYLIFWVYRLLTKVIQSSVKIGIIVFNPHKILDRAAIYVFIVIVG